ncbi:MAG: hypothetical protein ABSC51_02020 [Gaiellaceae bacterium]|jgi:hypothetical protein
MRTGSQLSGIPLELTKIERRAVGNTTAEQPKVWTMIGFEFAERDAERVIAMLAEVLDEHGGWYSDLWLGEERIVVFAGRVFRYARGDGAARAEAQAYGREHGVPDSQLDWAD